MLDGEQFDAKADASAALPSAYQSRSAQVITPSANEPPRPKVLVVEDDPAAYARIEPCLNNMTLYEPQITLAGNLAAAFFALASDEFDAVLLDCDVQAEHETELFAEVGKFGVECPIILMTSQFSVPNHKTALELVAAACISINDLTPQLLERVLGNALHGQFPPQEKPHHRGSTLKLVSTSSRAQPKIDADRPKRVR